MSLNDLFVGVGASVFGRHPNGRFGAMVSDVTLGKSQNGKHGILKLSLITMEGKAPDFMLFLISEEDALTAASNPEYKEKLIKSIQFNKGTLVRLGLVSEDIVKGWSQADMVKAFASLKGKGVDIEVSDDKNNPKYQRVSLIAVSGSGSKETKAEIKDTFGMGFSSPVPPNNLDDIPF